MTYIQGFVDERHLSDQGQRLGVDEVFQLLHATDGLGRIPVFLGLVVLRAHKLRLDVQ